MSAWYGRLIWLEVSVKILYAYELGVVIWLAGGLGGSFELKRSLGAFFGPLILCHAVST